MHCSYQFKDEIRFVPLTVANRLGHLGERALAIRTSDPQNALVRTVIFLFTVFTMKSTL